MKNEDELEFISVTTQDHSFDDNINRTYAANDPNSAENNSLIGSSWILNQSKHPLVVIFHLLFKALAIFFYIFGHWLTQSFIFTFVLCILLLAFDFWTVKNVSGRLLVGLRWWSYVKDDGSNEWIFESLEDMAEISAVDSRMFWGGLYVSPICWSLLLVVGVFRLAFEYLPIVIAALVLSSANIVGYIKCSTSAKNKMKSLMEHGVRQTSIAALENSSIRNWVLSSLLDITTNEASKGPGAV